MEREAVAKRFRAARDDSSIKTLCRTICENLNLPEGCIKFVMPSGRKFDPEDKVEDLRSVWDGKESTERRSKLPDKKQQHTTPKKKSRKEKQQELREYCSQFNLFSKKK